MTVEKISRIVNPEEIVILFNEQVDRINELEQENEAQMQYLKQLKEDIQIALKWYRHLPQHLMRYEDVKASHRLECYIKEQGDKEK